MIINRLNELCAAYQQGDKDVLPEILKMAKQQTYPMVHRFKSSMDAVDRDKCDNVTSDKVTQLLARDDVDAARFTNLLQRSVRNELITIARSRAAVHNVPVKTATDLASSNQFQGDRDFARNYLEYAGGYSRDASPISDDEWKKRSLAIKDRVKAALEAVNTNNLRTFYDYLTVQGNEYAYRSVATMEEIPMGTVKRRIHDVRSIIAGLHKEILEETILDSPLKAQKLQAVIRDAIHELIEERTHSRGKSCTFFNGNGVHKESRPNENTVQAMLDKKRKPSSPSRS